MKMKRFLSYHKNGYSIFIKKPYCLVLCLHCMVSECINFKAYGKVIEAFMARYAEVLKACRDRKLL